VDNYLTKIIKLGSRIPQLICLHFQNIASLIYQFPNLSTFCSCCFYKRNFNIDLEYLRNSFWWERCGWVRLYKIVVIFGSKTNWRSNLSPFDKDHRTVTTKPRNWYNSRSRIVEIKYHKNEVVMRIVSIFLFLRRKVGRI